MTRSQAEKPDPLLLDRDGLRSLLLPSSSLLPDSIENHAAVLLCLVMAEQPYTLLTRRTMHLSRHAGQISLPGGRVDACDASLEDTALREAREEIGLMSTALHVLGRLPDVRVLSGNGTSITPVVAWSAQEPSLNHNAYEVDEIIKLPLQVALNPSCYGTDCLERDGIKREFRFVRYQEHYIWGATARILLSLVESLR